MQAPPQLAFQVPQEGERGSKGLAAHGAKTRRAPQTAPSQPQSTMQDRLLVTGVPGACSGQALLEAAFIWELRAAEEERPFTDALHTTWLSDPSSTLLFGSRKCWYARAS